MYQTLEIRKVSIRFLSSLSAVVEYITHRMCGNHKTCLHLSRIAVCKTSSTKIRVKKTTSAYKPQGRASEDRMEKKVDFRETWELMPALILNIYLTLNKLYHFLRPQFLHVQIEEIKLDDLQGHFWF